MVKIVVHRVVSNTVRLANARAVGRNVGRGADQGAAEDRKVFRAWMGQTDHRELQAITAIMVITG